MKTMDSTPEHPTLPPQRTRSRTGREGGILAWLTAVSPSEVPSDVTDKPGLRLSALGAAVLSVAVIGLWFAPGAQWNLWPVIALAGILLSCGWNVLTGIEIPALTVIILALASSAIPLTVVLTGDLADGVCIFSLAIIAIATTILASTPAPRDHSIVTEPSEHADNESARRPLSRRSRPHNERPASIMACASALSVLALIGAGSTWIALEALPQWNFIVPIAAIIIAAVVWGDQIGSTFRLQSWGAFGVGIIGGPLAAIGAYYLAETSAFTPIILPTVVKSVGPIPALALIGAGAGLGVALAVIVVDAVLGEHQAPHPPLGALARGAAKFLVAALPIYAVIRIGAI